MDATRLEIRFQGKANAAAQTLKIWQQDVKLPWPVLLNGKPVGALVTSETALENLLTLPPGALQDAENVLTVEAPPTLDDIEVGPVSLHPEPIKEVLKEASLEVTVVDKFNGKGVPCRLTLTKVDGTLQPILAEPAGAVALRVGICYTGDGKAQLSVPVGDYVLHAGRGSEWECGTDRNSLG